MRIARSLLANLSSRKSGFVLGKKSFCNRSFIDDYEDDDDLSKKSCEGIDQAVAQMAAFGREKRSRDATRLLHTIVLEGLKHNSRSLVLALNSCCLDPRSFHTGELLHSWILELEQDLSLATGTALLNMYVKCGRIDRAGKVFEAMNQRHVTAWTIMIAALGDRGSIEESLLAFRAMQLDGIQPNSFTLVAIFQACTTRSDASKAAAKSLVSQTIETGLAAASWNVIVATAVIGIYGKCGSIDRAVEVFQRISPWQRDVVAWNSIITVCAEHSRPELGLEFFRSMQLEGVIPTRITFLKVVAAVTASGDLVTARLIHSEAALRSMDRDVIVGTALASMYNRFGRVDDLIQVLNRIEQGGRDLVCWNTIISALVQHSRSSDALGFFRRMALEGVRPDRATFAPLLSSAGILPEATTNFLLRQLSQSLVAVASSTVVGNAVINMHAKSRRIAEARRAFDAIAERDLVSWNTMIAAYVGEGSASSAREAVILFHRMQQEGFLPDSVTSTTIFAAYAELRGLARACAAMDARIFDRGAAWSLAIATLAQQRRSRRALALFRSMQLQGIRPDRATLVPIIISCGACGALQEGRLIHRELLLDRPVSASAVAEDCRIRNALIDMYGRCGKLLDVAYQTFAEIEQPNVISWTAIVAAFAQNSRIREASDLFARMVLHGAPPDAITFTTILSMCSHAGLVNLGCQAFGSMGSDHYLDPGPEHYNCVIDLLARAGWMDEAEELVRRMPVSPTVFVWTALLSACRSHGDVDRGQRIAGSVAEL